MVASTLRVDLKRDFSTGAARGILDAATHADQNRLEMNPLVTSRDLNIACLLGKRPRPGTVISEVIDRLRAIPASVTVHVQKGDAPLPEELADSHLVVQRGLGLAELSAAMQLETSGVRCCNRVSASIAVADRAA